MTGPFRVARFHNPLTGLEMFGDEALEQHSHDMIRCTGFVTVTFPPLEPESVARKLEAIERARQHANALYQRTLEELEARRLELLKPETDTGESHGS